MLCLQSDHKNYIPCLGRFEEKKEEEEEKKKTLSARTRDNRA